MSEVLASDAVGLTLLLLGEEDGRFLATLVAVEELLREIGGTDDGDRIDRALNRLAAALGRPLIAAPYETRRLFVAAMRSASLRRSGLDRVLPDPAA